MAVQSAQWQKLVEFEYLRRFTKSGGSSIKFIIADPSVSADLRYRISLYASDKRLFYVGIDSAATKLHMVQEAFFAVARLVDWERLAQERIEAAFKELRYAWPKPGSRVPLSELAAANGVAE